MATQEKSRRVIHVELHEAKKNEAARSFYQRINSFLDSKLGTALLTFIFTIVLGSVISYIVDNYQDAQAAKVAAANEATERRSEFRNYLANQLIGRSTATILLGSALANEMPREDISRRWLDYEKSYVKYNEMTFAFRNNTDGLKPVRFRGKNHLLAAMDRYVTPSFARMDLCVTRAYVRSGKRRKPEAKNGVLICGLRSNGEAWDLSMENADLRVCLQTYQKRVEDLIWLQDKFQNRPIGREAVEKFRKSEKCEQDDFACYHVKAWDALEAGLMQDCGKLDPNGYQSTSGD